MMSFKHSAFAFIIAISLFLTKPAVQRCAPLTCRIFDFLNAKKLDIESVIDIQLRKAVFFYHN